MNQQLLPEEYEILKSLKEDIQIAATKGYCKPIARDSLKQIQIVYAQVFGKALNINCSKCIWEAFKEFHPLIEAYGSK